MALKLTPLGESEAVKLSRRVGPESSVLNFMYATGYPVEMEEIMDDSHMDDEKAQKVVNHLITQGYIKEV